MDATHWMTAITQTLQPGAQALVMPWVHELSLAALAIAVVTLGCVMLLELRALAALRRSVDVHLARVFEQLDLIRFDHVQLLEAHARIAGAMTAAPVNAPAERAVTAPANSKSTSTPAALTPPAIAAGEARLLASLAEARARRAAAERAVATR